MIDIIMLVIYILLTIAVGILFGLIIGEKIK